jgi:hypothetical protein
MATSTVIKTILDTFLTSLYDIKTTNGYNNTVVEVLDGLDSNVSNYPAIIVQLGNEEAESYYETGENAVSHIDVWLLGYINSTTNDERDKFISDIKTFISGDSNIATAVFPLVKGSDYIGDYHIEDIRRPIAMGEVGIRIRFTFTEALIDTSLPSVPTLNLPTSGSSDSSLYTQFDWNSSSGAVTYDVQIATDVNFGNVVIETLDIVDTAYTVSYSYPLTNNTTYYWRVRARNIYGVSAWSSIYNYRIEALPTYEAETNTLAGRFTVTPDATRKGYMNTLIALLKTNNLWDKLDVLQIYPCHSVTNNDWGLNWRKDSSNAVSGGTGALTINVNSTVNTSGTNYIQTNFSAFNDGIAYSQNRASLGFKKHNNASGTDIFHNDGLGIIQINPNYGDGKYYMRLNTIGGTYILGTALNTIGFFVGTRETNVKTYLYKDGSLIQASGNDQTSNTMPTTSIRLGLSTVGQYSVFFAGTYITSAEKDILVNGINTYLTNIGVV